MDLELSQHNAAYYFFMIHTSWIVIGSGKAYITTLGKIQNKINKNTNIFCQEITFAKYQPSCPACNELTHKQLKTNMWILSTVATDVLVLKHQAISIHRADKIFIVQKHHIYSEEHLKVT